VPCSASRVVPGAHRAVGPGTHRGSGPREVHTTAFSSDDVQGASIQSFGTHQNLESLAHVPLRQPQWRG
jgi:hypothetical protein